MCLLTLKGDLPSRAGFSYASAETRSPKLEPRRETRKPGLETLNYTVKLSRISNLLVPE